jgi:aminoglycoside phosphotransferase (APT) family kinase protein
MTRTDLASGLARFLGERWGRRVNVGNIDQSSAGARRLNVLFDADDGERVHRLVATIIPNMNMLITSIPDEAAVLRVAERAGVTVAHVHFDTNDASYVGGPFFITTRIDGETVARRVLRLVADQRHGDRISYEIGASAAKLHAVKLTEAPAHLQALPDVAPAERALENLRLQVAGLLQPGPVFTLALRWLEQRQPLPPPRRVIVHGDIRNGNVVIDERGLGAILDWEGTRVGDPMEDLAWPCLRCWRFGVDDNEVGGFSGRGPLVEGYQSAGGVFDPERFHWWKVLGTMRWGLGLAGQAKQHLDGSVPNIVMAASGRRVAELEYDLLCLIKPSR